MKLQILIPQYKETEEVLKPMLNSLSVQENIDFNDFSVIICNDGSDVFLDEQWLQSFPFKVEYFKCKHQGVSATRHECFKRATADYVMWCDADDCFCDTCGLFRIFREIDIAKFDAFASIFREESRAPKEMLDAIMERRVADQAICQAEDCEKVPDYHNRGFIHPLDFRQSQFDSTFVHGKVYRRQFLIDKQIFWNPALTIHEDSYFNILAQTVADMSHTFDRYRSTEPFYLWKWRDESVCRHDPKYILKTLPNLMASNTALVREFLQRNLRGMAQIFVTNMFYDAYFTLNRKDWLDVVNKEFRDRTERRFKKYVEEFGDIYYKEAPEMLKKQAYKGQKNRFFGEDVFDEAMTLKQWLAHIDNEVEIDPNEEFPPSGKPVKLKKSNVWQPPKPPKVPQVPNNKQ